MRPARLYHHMDVPKALSVLRADAMPARFRHHDPVTGAYLDGNSFSRNASMGVRPTDSVRLVVDPVGLRARHRVVPLDSDAAFERYRRFLNDAGAVDWEEYGDYWNAYDLDPSERDRTRNAWQHQWAEEFVVGDIRDLHRHVVSVEVNHHPHPRWTALREAALAFGRRFGVPVDAEAAPRALPPPVAAHDFSGIRPVLRLDLVPLDIPYGGPPGP